MKPFRLLNHSELNDLATQLDSRLRAWNHKYTLLPIQLKVESKWPETSSYSYSIAHENKQIIALGDPGLVKLIQKAVFDTLESDLENAGRDLLLTLVEVLTCKKTTFIEAQEQLASEWAYKGNCTLALHLSCSSIKTTLLLNPEWVYQQLPKAKQTSQLLSQVNEAVNPREITCKVNLTAFVLPLKKLKDLNCGDVLITDHLIDNPLKLTIDNDTIAEASLGQNQGKKSIKIRRIL